MYCKAMQLSFLSLFLVGLSFGMGSTQAANAQDILIGTASRSGVYYQTGTTICRLVNRDRKNAGMRCNVRITGGSLDNIKGVRDGDLTFGMAQSDWQFHAYNGTSAFETEGPFEDLRAVFSVYVEPVTILARKDAGISNIADLKGKRVNIGNEGSGERATWAVLEDALGWTDDDLALATELKSSDTVDALCNNEIDAYFWLVGHPSAQTQQTIAKCDTALVEVSGAAIDELIAERPYYNATVIPAHMYPGQSQDIETFSVGATLITSASEPDDVVYQLVKSVFDNYRDFKNLYPAFASLTELEMISNGLSAPLHPGAVEYYKEQGWM